MLAGKTAQVRSVVVLLHVLGMCLWRSASNVKPQKVGGDTAERTRDRLLWFGRTAWPLRVCAVSPSCLPRQHRLLHETKQLANSKAIHKGSVVYCHIFTLSPVDESVKKNSGGWQLQRKIKNNCPLDVILSIISFIVHLICNKRELVIGIRIYNLSSVWFSSNCACVRQKVHLQTGNGSSE